MESTVAAERNSRGRAKKKTTRPAARSRAKSSTPRASRGTKTPARTTTRRGTKPKGALSMDRIWVKSYPPGVSDTLELPEEPLTGLLDDSVRRFPNNIATDFEG